VLIWHLARPYSDEMNLSKGRNSEMTSKNDCRIRRSRWTSVQRMLGNRELGYKLDEFEGFVRSKANKLAWTQNDRKDFEQVGREAVVKVFDAIQEGLKVSSEKGYYLDSIEHAMIDYSRKEYRPNYAVWEYDRKNGPTRVKRYRYRGEWKARIQYHGDKLKRVAIKYQTPLKFEEVFPYAG
jgi:hypothetical protein